MLNEIILKLNSDSELKWKLWQGYMIWSHILYLLVHGCHPESKDRLVIKKLIKLKHFMIRHYYKP
jgi:hypothetical protein